MLKFNLNEIFIKKYLLRFRILKNRVKQNFEPEILKSKKKNIKIRNSETTKHQKKFQVRNPNIFTRFDSLVINIIYLIILHVCLWLYNHSHNIIMRCVT